MGKKSKHKKQRNQQKQAAMPVAESKIVFQPTMSRAAGLELGEQYARRDIVRILILLGVVALVLVALVVIDGQSSFVLEAGRKLASIFRLS